MTVAPKQMGPSSEDASLFADLAISPPHALIHYRPTIVGDLKHSIAETYEMQLHRNTGIAIGERKK
jgi:hypothetical protein